MAKLPRRLCAPESSEGAGGGKHQQLFGNTCFCAQGDFYSYYKPSGSRTNWRPFSRGASQSEVLLQVFTSKAASAKVEFVQFQIWINLEKQNSEIKGTK